MAASPSRATWLRASSAHFVVYENTSEPKLRAEAVELERFDTLLRRYHKAETDPDSAFNKVTIYVVDNLNAMQKLARDRNVAGFYVPRVTGSVAFTPRISDASVADGDMTAQIVLYHEYAHHFLLGNRAAAYPAWFSEGYAEFVSTTRKLKDRYWLGLAANHRAYSLVAGPPMAARTLFAPPPKMDEYQIGAFYARAWLLTHYLMSDAARLKQLSRYLDAFNSGSPPLEAATAAFGDLHALDHALDRYVSQPNLLGMSFAPDTLGTPAVDVQPLSPGEAATIGFRIRSTAGVDSGTAGLLFAKAAPIAARYPADARVQGWLAEIALDASELDAAERAADAAIKAYPGQSQGLLYKARVLMARAVRNKVTDARTWDAARHYILQANRIENNDAAALRLYYDSFGIQGITPRDSAKQALYRAAELIPQDGETRFAAACQEIVDGQEEAARVRLRPLAADPHAAGDNQAARLIAALDAGKHGQAAIDAARAAGKDAAPAS